MIGVAVGLLELCAATVAAVVVGQVVVWVIERYTLLAARNLYVALGLAVVVTSAVPVIAPHPKGVALRRTMRACPTPPHSSFPGRADHDLCQRGALVMHGGFLFVRDRAREEQ